MTPPVSGCMSRCRSSSVSALPTMSMTTGPSGIVLACDIATRLQHYARARERSFVADGDMVADDASFRHQCFELRVEFEPRLACAVLDDADALERDGIAKTGPHRFRESFLRREAVRDEEHAVHRALVGRPFPGCQHPPRETFAVFVEQPRDA